MMSLEILIMMMTMKLRTQQIFNFVDVPSFASFLSGSPNEPLYFLKVTERGATSENHSDPYGHFISAGENFLKGF